MSAALKVCSLERWTALCDRLGLSGADAAYAELIAAHAQPHRFYHTLDHIAACLRHLDSVRSDAAQPDLIEMALWFHDAIYEPFSATNEEDSAAWAADWLQDAGAARDVFNRVADLILTTKAHARSDDPDTQILLDIDLSILGSPTPVYNDFELNIRREYKRVPYFIFKKKRKAILEDFLGRERLFMTVHFHKRFDLPARNNLKRTIAAL